MDCREFDGQVVRLEHIKDLADEFIRVRLPRIDNLDLNLFEFDYDVTMMIFFLNADERVYARYGGRDAENADRRQSTAGLHYTMASVLAMHKGTEKIFAPKSLDKPKFIRDIRAGFMGFGRGCTHCHQVREMLNEEVKRSGNWNRDMLWRYPLPENLGFDLETDRGNVIRNVQEKTPAAAAGLKAGDVVRQLNGVPVHSFGDAQFALDIAPKTGSIEIAWLRGKETHSEKLPLPEGWRKTDISWRTSTRDLLATARLYGADLSVEEKKSLGLSPKQLAFRQRYPVSAQAQAAGVHEGDIILGIDDKLLEMDGEGFRHYVASNFLIGERVTINILRDGKRVKLEMTFIR